MCLRIVHAKAHDLYREMVDLFPANERAPEVERALGERVASRHAPSGDRVSAW